MTDLGDNGPLVLEEFEMARTVTVPSRSRLPASRSEGRFFIMIGPRAIAGRAGTYRRRRKTIQAAARLGEIYSRGPSGKSPGGATELVCDFGAGWLLYGVTHERGRRKPWR